MSSLCTCGHSLDQHQRETLLCQLSTCPCQLFLAEFPSFAPKIKPGTTAYAQARNNLVVALQAMRARAAKAQEIAGQMGLTQLAEDCGLYVEDITLQISAVNQPHIVTTPARNVAVAQL